MSQKYIGGFITKSPVAPTALAASGMWTLDQAMQLKKQGLWPPLAIGAAYGGGFYAGQISTAGNGIADYNLVIGPVASAQSFLTWKNANTSSTGAGSDINGTQNTADLVGGGSSTVFPAAHFCNDLSTGGQTDWYMPSINELDVCYFNLKPTTQSNNTSFGINPNAVPARASNYTTGTPAQTSAANFVVTTGAEAFNSSDFYWSSTQISSRGRYVAFYNANRFTYSNTNQHFVRAIRRVAV